MMFSLVACGGDGDTNTTDAPETEATTQALTEAAYESVAVGDVTIKYLRAEKYTPFENGETILVYCKFTNNSTEVTSAQDIYNTIPMKLEFSIDGSAL